MKFVTIALQVNFNNKVRIYKVYEIRIVVINLNKQTVYFSVFYDNHGFKIINETIQI
jgi:hypothetical protein